MVFPISRFRNTIEKEFEIEVITPLFSGGADGNHAELRETAFKGVMRFWWRALHGSTDIAKMKKNEDQLFGSTEIKSNLRLSIKEDENVTPVLKNIPKGTMMRVKSSQGTFSISIIEYLAYGLYEYQRGNGNVFTKEHFQPETKFKLSLVCQEGHKTQIMDSLTMINQYGGFGARSRNGFGSVKIKGLDIKKLKTLGSPNELKPFTSFSNDSKLFLFKEQNKWDMALSDVGVAYKNARTSLERKHSFTRRRLVATPIIVRNEVSINERHAKPYFLHVNKLENGKFRGQILFLPYDYHLAGQKELYKQACSDMNHILKDAAEEVL